MVFLFHSSARDTVLQTPRSRVNVRATTAVLTNLISYILLFGTVVPFRAAGGSDSPAYPVTPVAHSSLCCALPSVVTAATLLRTPEPTPSPNELKRCNTPSWTNAKAPASTVPRVTDYRDLSHLV